MMHHLTPIKNLLMDMEQRDQLVVFAKKIMSVVLQMCPTSLLVLSTLSILNILVVLYYYFLSLK